MLKHLATAKSLLLISLCCQLASAEPLASKKDNQLIFGFAEFYPYFWTDYRGEQQGYMLDLAKQITSSAGYEIKAISLPAKRFLHMAAAGEIDFWFGFKNIGKYQEQVIMSSIPVEFSTMAIFSKEPMDEFKSLDKLKGKTLVTVNGYTYGGSMYEFINAPENQITQIKTSNHHRSLRVLFGRGADYLISYTQTVDAVTRDEEFPPIYSHTLVSIPSFITINKSVPNAEKIMAAMEVEAKRIIADKDQLPNY